MKGISLSMQSIVLMILGSLVLGVTIIFFIDSSNEPTQGISDLQEKISLCKKYANDYENCECGQDKYCEVENLGKICISLKTYKSCNDENNENNENQIHESCFKECCPIFC